MSVTEIKQCATRPTRLEFLLTQRDEFTGPSEPILRLPRFRTLVLSFGVDNRDLSQPNLKLLPGGRWIVGLAAVGMELVICCWDLHSPVDQKGILTPAARISGTEPVDLVPDILLDVQYDAIDDCVTLLVNYSPFVDGQVLFCSFRTYCSTSFTDTTSVK